MWINPLFAPEDPRARAKDIVDASPLATIISSDEVLVAHMPVLWRQDAEGEDLLIGHMPVVDPIARAIAAGSRMILVFHGPAAYITPRWYRSPGLPTYNYQVAHIHGEAKLLDEEALEAHLRELIAAHETAHCGADLTPWTMDETNEARFASLLPRVLGFTVRPDEIFTKEKLGQNRDMSDNRTVAAKLAHAADSSAARVATAMRRTLNI